MFGFKGKKQTKKEETEELDEGVFSPEPVFEPEPEPSLIPTPIDLPLDGVVPDPSEPDEPEPIEAAAPMLDFSPPAAGSIGDGDGEDSTSLADLFGGTEDETESSLGPVVNMAPQATISEVMEDLLEIKDMLRGRLDDQ